MTGKIKKDSYYWYKANWSKSPVLYLTQRRNTDRERKQTSVTVYSNIGTPKVYLNGKELTGIRKGYTDVHYIFDQVTLEKGKNKIKAVAVYNGKEYVDEIEWDYQSEKKRDADAHENKMNMPGGKTRLMDIKKEQRLAPTFVNLKSNTMKNTLQRYGLLGN